MELKGKRIRFGGPALPEGTETWYDHVNPDGSRRNSVFVKPGQEVDADRVVNAESYVERGMATVVVPEKKTGG